MPKREMRQRHLANVPAFAAKLDAPLEVEGHGTIKVDIAYGGMFYAIADARALGFEVAPHEARELAVLGEKTRAAARAQHDIVHPLHPEIAGVSIVQFAAPFAGPIKSAAIPASWPPAVPTAARRAQARPRAWRCCTPAACCGWATA